MRLLLIVAGVCLVASLAVVQAKEEDDEEEGEDVQVEVNAGPFSNQTEASKRDSKVFSLFSIVQFKNSGCKSQSTMSSGQSLVRNGTCYTGSECTNKGGTASGNCAAGFGVCCLFLVSASGTTITQNCTYIRNPSFPSVYTGTSSISYTVSKCSPDVCYLRLDFESFNILGPSTTSEPGGGTCPDTFTTSTPTVTGNQIPTICGNNQGQHVYLDLGNVATDTATLSFTFGTTTSTARTWEIKVSQITCSNPGRPPNGCDQYMTTLVGRLTTFNFKSTTSSHLISQDQTVCIRQALGYCCVQYQLCTDQTNPFTLDRVPTALITGLVDSSCTIDYVSIPGSLSGQCGNQMLSQFNRYCGTYLGLTALGTSQQPVCDCTAPFTLTFHTDAKVDTSSIIAPASRGDCLDFMQIPCTN